MNEQERLSTPPFAPKTVQALADLGLQTAEDVRQTGAVRAFLLLKAAGHTVTRSVLWQLYAAEQGKIVADIGDAEKNSLNLALKSSPPISVFPPREEMERWMFEALSEAEQAGRAGEIPVGAVVVYQGRIIARGRNACVAANNIGSHAEMSALAEAGRVLGNYRLENCDVYVTLEPCTMCASALIQSRVSRVVYAAAEPKTGAAGSVLNLFADSRLNKHTAVCSGICAEQSRTLLQNFFAARRKSSG
ncbi:MAG: tRNA adenosine(34) deaminase TadA [Neisseria sp.]|nr:tRNA adenosine(34) deaminase TadA [Neisseria sp.]